MAEVNVENVTVFIHHNVIWVAIANTKNKSGNAITGTRMSESLDRLVVPLQFYKQKLLNFPIKFVTVEILLTLVLYFSL